MRLLVVTQYFWPENFRINDLVAELKRKGHQVTVLTGWPNYPDGAIFPEYRKNAKSFSNYCGVDIIRVPLLARGNGAIRLLLNYLSFAVSASFIGGWKLRKHQFDAVFTCQLSPVTVGIPAIFIRTIKRIPMALWVLDLWPDTLEAIGVLRSKRLLAAVGKLVSFIYKRCDLIFAQSKSFIPKIKKYANSATPVCYFPSWAEECFNVNSVEHAPEISIGQQCFNIMFAGNIGDAQDFPAILDAAESLKENEHIRWLIVGDGRAAPWVKNEILNRGLANRIEMLGRYPLDRMPSFFKHADALLVSLKDEPIFSMTIPGKLQSYLAAGIPVIAMLNGEGAKLVESSAAGLVCPAGDSKGLASIALRLSKMSKAERVEMGNNGLAISAKEFDRHLLIDGLEASLAGMICDYPKYKSC